MSEIIEGPTTIVDPGPPNQVLEILPELHKHVCIDYECMVKFLAAPETRILISMLCGLTSTFVG